MDKDRVTGIEGFDIPNQTEDEVKNLRKIYFDCDDYKNVTWAVLLYYNFTFVTLVTGDGQ